MPAPAQACPPAAFSCCPADLPRIDFDEAFARFEREAVSGVCDTGRYRCRYCTWGEGPDVLFVHGMCDDRLSFVLPIALLSRRFRCTAYDLPVGRGDGADVRRYRHADHAADVLALLDHVGARRATLFGSSFGSTIALAALHRAPDRFPRAVLQGGFARRPLAPAEVMLASWARYWPWAMRHLPGRVAVSRHGHFAPFADRPPEFWGYFLERSGSPPMRAVAHRALMIHRLDLRPILPSVRQPILLVCGDADPLVGKECEEELLRGLPNAVRAELTGCGHLPQFSHPEALAELTARFLGSGSL